MLSIQFCNEHNLSNMVRIMSKLSVYCFHYSVSLVSDVNNFIQIGICQ